MKKLALAILLLTGSVSAHNTDYQSQIDDLKAGLHTVHMNTPEKYSESWGLEDRSNIEKLQETKVDKSVFSVDQARQDKALADYVTKQANTDAKQTSDLKGYADKKATSAYTTSVAHTDVKVARADADRKAGDDALSGRIDSTVAAQSTRDAGQDEHINAVQSAAQIANEKGDANAVRSDNIETNLAVTDNRTINNAVRLDSAESGIRETNAQVAVTDARSVDNSKALTTKVDTSVFTADQARQDNAISNETVARVNGDKALSKRVDGQASQLSNHETRLGSLEQNTNQNFSNLRNKIDENQRHTDAAISGVAAMANIPQVTEYQSFAVGAGVGAREGENAVAVGFSARASQNVVLKASVAGDSQQTWTVGAGMSYGW